ncbi:MAG TPA: flagellin, partial [Thermoclostridium caenicola]|nr:flagellin [Thermoclostridium caenicola]
NIEAGTYTVEVTAAAKRAEIAGSSFADAAITVTGIQNITVNGQTISFEAKNNDAAATAANFIAAINNAGLGITASGGASGIKLITNEYGADQIITIGASSLTEKMKLTTDASTNTTAAGVNVAGKINGKVASGSGRTLISTSGASIGLKVELTGAAAEATGDKGSVQVAKNALTSHIGANANQTMTISISSMGSVDLSVNNLDLTSQSGANSAITSIDNAIRTVSAERSKLGAYQNRLEHTINNLGTSAENLSAAESRIRDVDMAKEMMEFTKNSILQQAAQAMLAQANQMPQNVLQLLR